MKSIIIAVILSCLLTSCGTTQLVSSNTRADIYVNDVLVGKNGSATIKRAGAPHTAVVRAHYRNRTIGTTTIKRRFTWGTALVGYYTMGVGLFCYWQYPSTAVISCETIEDAENQKSPWDTSPGSSW